jgi:hypothetical protein
MENANKKADPLRMSERNSTLPIFVKFWLLSMLIESILNSPFVNKQSWTGWEINYPKIRTGPEASS